MDPLTALTIDAGTVALITALGTIVLGGGGYTGWVLAHRRLRTIEEPTAAASIAKTEADTAAVNATTAAAVAAQGPTTEQLRAQAEVLHAQARTAEVDAVLRALEGVSSLWEGGQVRLERQAGQIETMQGALYEVQEQMAQFERAWQAAREMLDNHGKWDQQAVPVLRTIDPEFPDPPPLSLAAQGHRFGPPGAHQRATGAPRQEPTPPASTD